MEIVQGQSLLAVSNINEGALTGEAFWEQVPVSERPQNPGDPNYVKAVLAFGPQCSSAPVQNAVIDHVYLMTDDFKHPLDWNKHVIGFHDDVKKINIQIEGRNLSANSIQVQVVSLVANGLPGETSVDPTLTPVQFDVPRDASASDPPQRMVYRRTLDLPTGRPGIPEVATIKRPGGTSDKFFRDALGWAPRGVNFTREN